MLHFVFLGRNRGLVAAILVCCVALVFPRPGSAPAQSSNGVLREVYLNIGGNSIPELTNHATFPGSPSLESIQPEFEAPVDFEENFGQRLRALLLPPTSGLYTFWIATDDNGALYLSTNEDPANKVLIARVNGWTSSREWTKEPNQQSAAIMLQAGQRYYIEALQKEGTGGDNVAVRWQLPDGTLEGPIPNRRLVAYGLGPPIISRQPTNALVIEGNSTTFTVQLQRMLGATFQWHRNGNHLSGATNSIYTVGPLSLLDSNSRFRCYITNSLGTAISAEALLTVVADSTAPTLSTVGNLGDPQVIFVVFSESVEAASATNVLNYTLSDGVTVTRTAWGTDGKTVILTTTPMDLNVVYRLTVNNVRDRASTPNSIAPNTQRTFTLTSRPVDISLLTPFREPIGPSSRRHGLVISEVMYHPVGRPDGRNTEFIELYNAQPWFEDLSGWRISGAIDYRFPSNTVLQSRSYLLVAANPADLVAVYGPRPVLGPFAGSDELPNGSGTLRLRNRKDAVIFEMAYSDEPPFPSAADGAGHSLVLARASYGEADPRAWLASEVIGGTPGAVEINAPNPLRTVMINEFLAHTDLPELDYIELYNYGTGAVNIGGCTLSDDPTTNKFIIPANTTLAGRSFRVFNETNLSFALSADGERIIFKNADGSRVLDAVRFGGQENRVSFGRYPDGAPQFSRLAFSTPGTNNGVLRAEQIVINEIMFEPINSNPDDEYIELHNRGLNAVNLTGWRIRNAVSFNIPAGTVLPGGGYLVIARNAASLRARYPTVLTAQNTLGNYTGRLSNNGDRIELNGPDDIVVTNQFGQPETETIHIVVDEVTYGTGGRWGRWSAGGGSSLELVDARADGRRAPNWADSEEDAKSPWVTVEATGMMDNGWADAYQLHVTLLGAGEALIDNVEVIPAGGANVVANSSFEGGSTGWVAQGNHNQTSWETASGFNSARSLHLRTTGRGDTGSNRVRTQLPSTIPGGTTVTLRAKVRWLKGNPNILLRLRGNWLEAPGNILAAQNLGTPGARNSQARSNAGPAIVEVRHLPALPATSQPVVVQAQVHDPDGIAYLVVHYRIDPGTNYQTVAMTNNGAGLFSTTLPAQANGTTVGFFVQAADNFAPPAFTYFPNDAPARECVVRWGDIAIPGTLPIYRFWITQTNINRWTAEEKMSNNPKDITFVYGTNRVFYNAGGFFHGSPYHSPVYNSPVGGACDYDLVFAEDDRLLGETDINLFRPGNGGGDGTGQREIHAYWFGDQFGVPYLYHRPVIVYVNGQRRETVFHDAQQPNGDFVAQWFPDDADGNLHKIQLGFEFGDQAYGAGEPGYTAVGADLGRYTTTGGQKKLARYRQTWPVRAASVVEQNDYTNLFALVDGVNTSAPIGSDSYTSILTAFTDVEEWFKVHVTQHLYNNYDSFSYGGGQNAFAYKPSRDPWQLFLWDVDFAFGGAGNDANLTGIGGAEHGPRNDHPPFARIYWQALMEAANGMLTPARSTVILDARYNGMVAGGATVGDPQQIKTFIAERRALILSRVQALQSTFVITSNNGLDFTTNRNLITLTGTAPLEVRSLLVNGIAYRVTWTALNAWRLSLPLAAGLNTLNITAQDPAGTLLPGVAGSIRVTFTGIDEAPENKIVINEIMYHPAVANAEFVEIQNTSISNAFDLSRWRLDGIDFDFPDGSVLEPNSFMLVAKDSSVFASAYGANLPVIGEFPGQLDKGGETLTLLRPGPTPGDFLVVDQVTYDDDLPWPATADGAGSSLQLLDPRQDNNRAANWAAISLASTNPPQTLLAMTHTWRYDQSNDLTGVNWISPAYNDTGWQAGPGLLYNETAALPGPKNTLLNLGRNTYYFRGRFNHVGNPAGASLNLRTILDDGAIFYLNGQELHRLGMPGGSVTYGTFASVGVGDAVYEGPILLPGSALVSGENLIAVEVHQVSASSSDIVFGMELETTFASVSRFTPGNRNSAADTLPAFPELYLNEILPNNFFLGANGIVDNANDRDPWLELYNRGTNPIALDGYFLANNFTNLMQWTFPSNAVLDPQQFLVVWLDGEPEESTPQQWHLPFRAAAAAGSIVLSRGPSLNSIVDYLNYDVPVAGHSHGSFPDGTISHRRSLSVVTPNAPNNATQMPVEVRINEWMADNGATLADDVDGRFEDWFELFNAGPEAVDLSGYFLSDNATNTTDWRIPDGTVIAPRGYLLVWADSTPAQNSPEDADVHADFSLARDGEEIGLFAPNGTVVDVVHFGLQTRDRSEGRFPDGNTSMVTMTNATPRQPNSIVTDNAPPTLSEIAPQTVDEGALLVFTAVANDTNVPAQRLTFSLDPGAPPAASINSTNGIFRWAPTEADGPATHVVTIRVSDDGQPNFSATRSVAIQVREFNDPPVLGFINSRSIDEGSVLTITNTASDPDGSAVLTFALQANAPTGMTLHATSGILVWTPAESQGPGTYSVGVTVTDDGDPPLSATRTFSVQVREVNATPQLSFPNHHVISSTNALTFTATAADLDLPQQPLTFSIEPGGPPGPSIDSATGLFYWVPGPGHTGTNLMNLRVTDAGSPPGYALRVLTVVVLSSLRVEIARNGPQVTLSFDTTPGRTYQVQQKKLLTASNWLNLGSPMPASSGRLTIMDVLRPGEQRFYRVVQLD